MSQDDHLAKVRDLFEERTGLRWEGNVILLGYVGSIAHGTHTPSTDPDTIDDVDTMGVVIPPAFYTLGGVRKWEGCVIQEGEVDAVFYSLEKFAALLVKSNPNVLGTLWLPEEHLLVQTEAGRTLQEHRRLFSTLNAYPSFVGYAYGQLHRMEAFDLSRMEEYEWFTEQLTGAGIKVRELLEADSMKLAWFKKQYTSLLLPDQFDRFRSLQKQYFSGYMGAKRKALVKRIGYDAKNAAHLIRLMRMCIAFLADGILRVDRTGIDADELRAIKSGAWTLDQVKGEAERLFAEAKIAKESSPLPATPDLERIGNVITNLHLETYRPYANNWNDRG